ncbi:MAG: tRNA (adenosine(37)-N6)-threonylcarbamoyltransferase complex ATPase subunit type 1 TsaE [Eubacterium sp.]|nr:tRNA (adenosine(37)-N6)-threonylcarbamoyltransferase complex ATPase subunit type 1 TsaE [Eubacterium sp.]MBR2278186.1 tRNA (adenosine(37)-N6)-threonylcarbamoyltransferase complex ATPase subunit type 1 TsaE [Eubacterium sp.]
MTEFITHSAQETEQKAAELAQKVDKGCVIGFLGELGAGKTAFTRGFVKGLGIDADVSSPTFAVCNDYIGENARALHYDMYRVDGWDDLYSVGFFDSLDSGAYILCEWSENIFGALPDDALIIKIEKIDDTSRRFTIVKKSEFEV